MDDNKNNMGSEQPTETNSEEKTYTQAEVDELLQRESDKRVSQALKKQQAKTEARVREAQKLAAMSEQDKYVYELEQREKAIEEKERALAMAENKNEASKILADMGLDLGLVDFVVCETAEETNNKIKQLEKAFKKSVKFEVEKRLSGNTPKKGLPPEKAITKEDFRKMTYAQMVELKTNNPELYAELSKL